MTIVAAVATLCGSIGLYPLFVSGGWFWAGLGAVTAVSAAGALVRRYRLPALANLAGGLAALHMYVTVVYASDQAYLGIVPTPASFTRLAELVTEGWHAANTYAAPVPLIPGISLLATLGIGLVAALVDLLAVRLRRAAPAGLPLLALYSVPAAIREESISWLAFGVGAAGYLWLLLADARVQVTSWGRPVFTSRWSDQPPREQASAGALALTGRRIGVTAVAAALLLPSLVPGIQPKGFFGMGGTGEGGRGARTVTTLDPLVSLKRELTRTDDAVVLTFRSTEPQPDYLRLYALDRFDGDRWTYSELSSSPRDKIKDKTLPPAPGLAVPPAGTTTTRIAIGDRVDMKFLPMPYPPTRVDIDGDWRVHGDSLMVFSLRDAAGGRDYTVNSLRVAPTAAQLEAAGPAPPQVMGPFTRVPSSVTDRVRKIAEDVTRSATSPYQKALLLQQWFTNGQFTYSLAAPPPKRVSDLMDFLEGTKAGYCEQFAASMALMARELKIPARVAMGYTPGTLDTKGDWVVRSRDTHAWPELYFPGIGWVRFEPTPSGPAGQGTANVPQYAVPAVATPGLPSTPSGGASAAPTPSTSGSPNGAVQRPRDPDNITTPTGLSQSSGTRVPYALIVGVAAAVLLLLTPMATRLLARRRRWAGVAASGAADGPAGTDTADTDAAGAHDGGSRDAESLTAPLSASAPAADASAVRGAYAARAAWAELRADAIDYRVEWRPAESPRAVAKRLARQLNLGGTAADALTRIAMAEERARYAPSPGRTETLRADSRLMRKTFAASAGRWTRIRAWFFPPSTMAAYRAAFVRLLDMLDRFDSAAFAARARWRARGTSPR
ncbi:MAG TPA: transglutaminaseTgpA domain-containing protein [Streptosporangiaceae bacterium]|nr:transglutaminaseTgpA domain-containing protein [Streptosporangiaceae bacterium]